VAHWLALGLLVFFKWMLIVSSLISWNRRASVTSPFEGSRLSMRGECISVAGKVSLVLHIWEDEDESVAYGEPFGAAFPIGS